MNNKEKLKSTAQESFDKMTLDDMMSYTSFIQKKENDKGLYRGLIFGIIIGVLLTNLIMM